MIFILIPTGEAKAATFADTAVRFSAPANYKDPSKIAEYVNEKYNSFRSELFSSPMDYLHILDVKVNVYTGEEEVIKEGIYLSQVPELIEKYNDEEELGYSSRVLIMGPNSADMVKAIRRYQFNAAMRPNYELTSFDPLYYMIGATDFNNLTDEAKNKIFADFSSPYKFYTRAADVFSNVIANILNKKETYED